MIKKSSHLKSRSDANNYLALFIRDLFVVYDRGQAIDMVRGYIEDISPAKLETQEQLTLSYLKFDFLKIVVDYEHYIQLNLPLPHKINSAQNLTVQFCDKFPMASIIVKEVIMAMKVFKSELRWKAIDTLSWLLTKHDYDSRYQDKPKREAIARIYLSILLLMIDEHASIISWRERADFLEQRSLMVCLLFVLKECDRNTLMDWWKHEIPSRLMIFFDLLRICIETFEVSYMLII